MFASPFGFEVKALATGALVDGLARQPGALETDGLASMGMLLVPRDIIIPALMTVDAGRLWHAPILSLFVELSLTLEFCHTIDAKGSQERFGPQDTMMMKE
jgi:hypothetical protein